MGPPSGSFFAGRDDRRRGADSSCRPSAPGNVCHRERAHRFLCDHATEQRRTMQVAARRCALRPASYFTTRAARNAFGVNIFTSKEIRAPRHALLNDPIFRRFFGDQVPYEAQPQPASALASSSCSGGYRADPTITWSRRPTRSSGARRRQEAPRPKWGNDPETDLAVLRLARRTFRPIASALRTPLPRRRRRLAIGKSFGVGQTVTSGTSSASAVPARHTTPSRTSSQRPRDQPGNRAARWSMRPAT